MGKAPPTTRRLLLGKTAKVRFDTARAKNILGWRPAVPWREGMSRAVAHNAEAAEALRRTQSAAESAVLEP
jgi:nucleoside-diphosphate-sugar epimerase